MNRTRHVMMIAAAVTGLTTSSLATAQSATASAAQAEGEMKKLSVGDTAPGIEISHWVRGEPVETFKKNHVYVVEFWATWCGPCRASIPHIASLQNKYEEQNVHFVGISDEDLPTVVGFLAQTPEDEAKNWYEKMDYTVATDPDRSVYTDYMKAANQRGIPTAFLVGKTGHVEWIGHPMSIDDPLEQVVKDTWDRQAYQAEFQLNQKLNALYAKGQFEEAVKHIDTYLADHHSDSLEMAKFQLLLGPLDRESEAYAMADRILESNWEDASMLNMISWNILTDEEIEERDFDIALKAAERACKLSDWSDAAILDTLARAYYEKGDLVNAIKWQKEALEHADNELWQEDFKSTLEQYQNEAGKDN